MNRITRRYKIENRSVDDGDKIYQSFLKKFAEMTGHKKDIRVLRGVITSNNDYINDEEIDMLSREIFDDHPDLIILNCAYSNKIKSDSIAKLEMMLEKELAFNKVPVREGYLVYGRFPEKEFSVKLNYGSIMEIIVVWTRNTHAVLNICKKALNYLSDSLEGIGQEELKKLSWDIIIDKETQLYVRTRDLDNMLYLDIRPIEKPDGKVGYSLGYNKDE